MKSILPEELHSLLQKGEKYSLLDVREGWEHALVRLEGSLHIPVGSLPAKVRELDPAQSWVIYCHHGNRSAWACQYLQAFGLTEVYNLSGGIDRWSRTVDPALPTY